MLPLAILQFNMLITIEFPDAAGDAAVGKRTLVVRLGAAAGARISQAALVGVYGSLPLLIHYGLPRTVAFGVLAGLPLGAWQFWRVGRGDATRARRWENLALGAVVLLVGTAAGELAAFIGLLSANPWHFQLHSR